MNALTISVSNKKVSNTICVLYCRYTLHQATSGVYFLNKPGLVQRDYLHVVKERLQHPLGMSLFNQTQYQSIAYCIQV